MLVMAVLVFAVSYNVQENQAVYWSVAVMLLYAVILLLFFREIFGKKTAVSFAFHRSCI